jgi:hypothetical protein
MKQHPLVDALREDPGQVAQHEGWSVEAEGAQAGAVGIQADALRFKNQDTTHRDAATTAGKLAERINYLLEPLAVIEKDRRRAMLRSEAPADGRADGDYYEMWVEPDGLSVERYHGEPGQRREPRPVSLTWEQADRLARDVEAAFAPEDAEQ